jgi:colanic acid/amylovoran biosynthesis glycosyltransferase
MSISGALHAQASECRLKIAYLINEYPKISHSFIRREILALEKQGFEILRLAVRGWDSPLPDEQDRRERERTRYVLRQGAWRLLPATLAVLLRRPARFVGALRLTLQMARKSDRALPHHLMYLAEACRVLSWLRGSGVQWMHAHFGTNSTDVAMLVHALGGPAYSFTAHGPEEFLRPIGLADKIQRSGFVVAISSFGRSQLCLWTRHDAWSKVRIARCGLEKSYFDAAPSPSSAARLVCVGRLAAEKGQLLLIEAAARVAGKGVPFELIFAGDGPMRRALEDAIAHWRLQDRITITGWLDSAQVRAEILASRALVSASFAEGLPVVIMEAMALCRPVIATYVAGIPELVRHGENGWLVPAACVAELAAALEQCLASSPEALQRMGEEARKSVLQRHCIDTEAAKLAVLFRQTSALRARA